MISVNEPIDSLGLLQRTVSKIKSTIFSLPPIDISAAIDRAFRFLEMSFLTVLVGLAYSIVDEEWAFIITFSMSIAAGIYVAKPIVDWLPAKQAIPPTLFQVSILSLSFAVAFVTLTLPLQALVRATFQIDQKAALASYARLEGGMAFGACARGHGSYEECVKAEKDTEERILSHHSR